MINIEDEVRAEQWVFEIFAKTYPVESFDLNPERFCNYIRAQGHSLTDLEIKEFINESRTKIF